jgi:hypothetical protein
MSEDSAEIMLCEVVIDGDDVDDGERANGLTFVRLVGKLAEATFDD